MVQLKFPNGRQYSEKVEYLDDYHMRIGSAVQHICEFAERMARSHATVLLSCEADGRSKFSLEFEGGC